MTTATAIDWNAWRAVYDETTFMEQRDFYNEVFALHPVQDRFSVKHLHALLEHIGQPVSVVELGGWTGEFAAAVLPKHPEIVRWRNYEISSHAVDESVYHSARFEPVALRDWYWSWEHTCDLFVASHVLEHLKLRDVLKVFDVTDAPWMYLQAPLGSEPPTWDGYRGSHILEVGWAWLTEELQYRGYHLLGELSSHPHVRCFEREPL
jgi:hypothetical protein